MDSTTLLRLCLRDSLISRCFVGVFPCNKLPKKISWPTCLIANTQPSNNDGEHWIAIFINKEGYGDYFCSYGQKPLKVFADFLDKHTQSWYYSQKCLQNELSTTCGQYCLFFLHARANGLSLEKLQTLFTRDKLENDEIVTAYINGLYDANTKLFDATLFL
jgi:hypothetical protein